MNKDCELFIFELIVKTIIGPPLKCHFFPLEIFCGVKREVLLEMYLTAPGEAHGAGEGAA